MSEFCPLESATRRATLSSANTTDISMAEIYQFLFAFKSHFYVQSDDPCNCLIAKVVPSHRPPNAVKLRV